MMNYAEQSADDCLSRWKHFYLLRALYIASALVVVPGSVIIGIIFEAYGLVPFLGTMAIGAIAYHHFGTKLVHWACPRCGGTFSSKPHLGRRIPLVEHCVHCGLGVGECP